MKDIIFQTSGTTGKLKKIIMKPENQLKRCSIFYNCYDQLNILKYFNKLHSCLPKVSAGGTITTRIFADIYGMKYVEDKEEASVIFATPHQWEKLMINNFLLKNCQLIISIGMILTEETRNKIAEFYQKPILDLYSSSETGPIAMNGVIPDEVQVKLENNRIYVKTTGFANGYIDRDFEFKDGWFDMCDLGKFEENRLIVTGRIR